MNASARDLAVVIVTWNNGGLILDCLRTLYDDLNTSGLDAGVWVVDNQSSDGTAAAIRDHFPATHLIDSGGNLGFAAGNNVALRVLGFRDQPTPDPAGPRAVFLLNPDTLVQPGAIRVLYDALFRLPKAGIVGAQLAYGDGVFQHSAFHFPGLLQIIIDLYPTHPRLYESALNGRYSRQLYAGDTPFPVDHPLGATMMFRREAIEQTGLFDEQFYMYCEEVDWSMRIRRAGWEVYTVPTAHVTHLEGRSTRQVRPRSIVDLWTSRIRLYTKHYSPLKVAAARWLIRGGMRLQIRKARQAIRTGAISADEGEALIQAYQTVMSL